MKKVISLILSVSILTVCAFATSKVTYGQPDDEINNKIVTAIKEDQDILYNELYNLHDVKRNAEDFNVYCMANINGDYYVQYKSEDDIDIDSIIRLGGCYLWLKGEGYAVYQTDTDELTSLNSAYSSGVISESDLESILKYYNDERKKGNNSENLGSIIGDVNADSIIDILDLMTVRRYITNSDFNPISEIIEDVNGDKSVDITDIVIMRSTIVNGK